MSSSKVKKAITGWIGTLQRYAGNFPAKGTLGGALVVLERLKTDFDLDIDAHTAASGTQIAGLSGNSVKKILIELGEQRGLGTEVGRTNRGARSEVSDLLDVIGILRLETLSQTDRRMALTEAQKVVAEKVAEWFNQQRITFEFDSRRSTRNTIGLILSSAKESGKEGAVAQHLVGAKLAMRFPRLKIANEGVNTADTPTKRNGDFHLGDMPIHVTVAPMSGVFEKCRKNISKGYRPLLLVPDRYLQAARDIAGLEGLEGLAVESIESYVALNCDELSEGSRELHPFQLKELLTTYNKRVDAVEVDKSLQIEIPLLIVNAKPRD